MATTTAKKPLVHEKEEVKALLESRLRGLHRQESKTRDIPQKSFCALREAILEEVMRMAHGHEDDESLITIIDYCIEESEGYKRLSTSAGLRSYYSLRIRVLRAALIMIRRFLRKRRWLRKRRARN